MKAYKFHAIFVQLSLVFAICIAGLTCYETPEIPSGVSCGTVDADCDGSYDDCDNYVDLTDIDCDGNVDSCVVPDLTDADCDGNADSCVAPDLTDADCDGRADSCRTPDLTDADCDDNVDGCVAPDLTDADCDGILDGCDEYIDDTDADCDDIIDGCDPLVDLTDADCDGNADACEPVGEVNLKDVDCDDIIDACEEPGDIDTTDADCDNIYDGCDIDLTPADLDCDGIDDCSEDPEDIDKTDNDCDGVVDRCEPDSIDLTDTDEDGIPDGCDNCPDDPNSNQANRDGDNYGDVCDVCPDNASSDQGDSDGDGIGNACDNCPSEYNPDQADSENDGVGDGIGDVCDLCPDIASSDPGDADRDGVGNACDDDYPTFVPASLITVPAGQSSVKYVGKNPMNEAYYQSYEFRSNGTVTKIWNPAPGDALPGELTCTGTWNYSGNQLTIDTTASKMGMTIKSVEIYDFAFTYQNGNYLDISSGQQITAGDGSTSIPIGSTILGTYKAHMAVTAVTVGMLDMDTDSVSITTVTAGNPMPWTTTMTPDIACSGSLCSAFPISDDPVTTNGSLTVPDDIWLFDLNGIYILQTVANLVLTRQQPQKSIIYNPFPGITDPMIQITSLSSLQRQRCDFLFSNTNITF